VPLFISLLTTIAILYRIISQALFVKGGKMQYKEWYYKIIIKRIWLVIVITLLFTAGGYFVTKYMITPLYSSTAKLLVVVKSSTLESENTVIRYEDFLSGQLFVKNYLSLIESDTVVETVINDLGLDMDVLSFSSLLHLENILDTGFIIVEVRYSDPQIAKEIADSLCATLIKTADDYYHTQNLVLLDAPQYSDKIIYPNILLNLLIVFIAGLFISIFGIIIWEFISDKVKMPEEIEKRTGMPVIGIIHRSKSIAKKLKKS
jgi:capsular polysaccharide biosynthesis protein